MTSKPRRGHAASQVGALALGSVLRIVLFTQFWTALLTRGTDPVTGAALDRGPALATLAAVGAIEITLLGLTWRTPGGTASGLMVVLSAVTAVAGLTGGQPIVGAGYALAALCFLAAPWLGPRPERRAP